MYLQISKQYFSSKENLAVALALSEAKLNLVKQFENEIQKAIEYYNDFRSNPELSKAVNYKYLINANDLNSKFTRNLPSFNYVIGELEKDPDLSNKVFSNLRDNNYFKEVWQINNPENLLGNLIILIYRTTTLYLYEELLLDTKGNQKVQISSTLEEMLASLWLSDKKTKLFDVVKPWIKNWEIEGFSKELSEIISTNKIK